MLAYLLSLKAATCVHLRSYQGVACQFFLRFGLCFPWELDVDAASKRPFLAGFMQGNTASLLRVASRSTADLAKSATAIRSHAALIFFRRGMRLLGG